jgi:hypothetical protein
MKNKLKKIVSETDNKLKKYVAKYWLGEIDDYEETDNANIKSWYLDLMQGGCESGFVSPLIYTADCQDFYDKYYEEIEEIREELEGAMGESLKPEGDLKNWYAWLGFEETARTIAEEIGLEV